MELKNFKFLADFKFSVYVQFMTFFTLFCCYFYLELVVIIITEKENSMTA